MMNSWSLFVAKYWMTTIHNLMLCLCLRICPRVCTLSHW